MPAGTIAIKYGFQGQAIPSVTACASGSNAIGEAVRAIRHGYADVIVTGGAEAPITEVGVAGFNSMKALCTSEDPNAASMPFDKRRCGFVIAEGAGILVLEEYERAVKRGAPILGEVVGYGTSCDAYHMTAPHPEAEGGARAIADAWKETGVDTDRIYYNAHGTGTPMNDKAETLAVKRAFGEELARKVVISSTKSMPGHMLGASGAAEAVVAVKALVEGIAPPTIGLTVPDPDCDLDYTPLTARKAEFDVSLSSSLGFGGHNAVLAFRKV